MADFNLLIKQCKIMNKIKDYIIKWAIKQIAKEENGTYGSMRYLEDVIENEHGEKMFIFNHKLVPRNNKSYVHVGNENTLLINDCDGSC